MSRHRGTSLSVDEAGSSGCHVLGRPVLLVGDFLHPVHIPTVVGLLDRDVRFYVDWDAAANDMAALLHAEIGRNPSDRRLLDLVGKLSTQSDDFRTRWAAHNVLFHRTGTRRFRHPVVGQLTLAYQDLDVPQDPDQTVLFFTAQPDSSSAKAMGELARSISATRDSAAPTEPGAD